MNKRGHMPIPSGVNVQLTTTVSNEYMYLPLPIPGSGLNARNASGFHPYYKRQPLKNLTQIEL